jgi:hypothetical protein
MTFKSGRRPIEIVSNRQPHKLAIIALVVTTKPGDIIHDPEIDRATNSTLQVWSSAMQSARRVLAVEHGIELKRETKLGYRHLKPEEKPGAADRQMNRARNRVKTAKRIVDSMTQGQFDELTPANQSVHVQTRARVLLTHDMMSPKRQREIAVAANSKERPMLPK